MTTRATYMFILTGMVLVTLLLALHIVTGAVWAQPVTYLIVGLNVISMILWAREGRDQ